MKTVEEQQNKSSLLERISFGMGDFAANGTFTFVSSYLLYYYTDSAGISLKMAGLILLIGRVVDAIASVLVGSVVDRTKSKFGKCRPYLIISIIPMMVLMSILFTNITLPEETKVIIACITYSLFSLCYAFYNVPYSTLISVIADNNKERIAFNVFKNFGANIGALVVTMSTLYLIPIFGGSNRNGYQKTALLYAVLFLVAALMCFRFTKERVETRFKDNLSLRQSVSITSKNSNWIIFVFIQFMGMFYMILHNQGTFYYTKYYLGNENLSTAILSLTPFMCILCALILPGLSEKIGMKKILISGHAIVFASFIGTIFVGQNIVGVMICSVFTSFGWSIATGMIFVMHSQLIDWSQKQSGSRPQGFMTSCMTFLMKMGVAIAGLVGPLILKIGGYIAEEPAKRNTIIAMKADYVYIPAVISLLVIALCMAYHGKETGKATKYV